MRASGKVVAKIKVLGIGGAGNNAINAMVDSGDIKNIEFIAMNTDIQDLMRSKAQTRVQLGEKITKGLGAGANPEVGRLAAQEDEDSIRSCLTGTDLLFITAGMGGGTGTGAAHMVAKIAKELGILTAAIVTKPFSFEGERRSHNAELGIDLISKYVDTIVVIPNDRLLELPNNEITLVNAFEEANQILKIGMKSIADLITKQGYINLDFADVKTIMSEAGVAMLGFGYASGQDRAKEATHQALSSPLLERPISGARRVLINITGDKKFTLSEANLIAKSISEATGDSVAEVIFGTVLDENLEDGIRVTVIATDFTGSALTKNENRAISYQNESFIEKSRSDLNEYADSLDIPAFVRKNQTKKN